NAPVVVVVEKINPNVTLPEGCGNCSTVSMANGQQTVNLRPQSQSQPQHRHLPRLEQACTKCNFSFLSPSQPKGLEEFFEVIGVNFYRCHSCNTRYIRCFGRTIRRRTRRNRPYAFVIAAVGIGLMLCAALAFWILRLTHRGPL